MKFYIQSGRQVHYYNEGIKKIDMLFVECLENYSISTTYEKGKNKNFYYNICNCGYISYNRSDWRFSVS